MIKESIVNLIDEMKEVKAEHATLEIPDVLRIFTIDATRQLTRQTSRMADKAGCR